ITQKEFYRFFSFFNSVAEDGGCNEKQGNHAPTIQVAQPEQLAKITDAKKKVSEIDQQIAQELTTISYADPALTAEVQSKPREQLVWVDDDLPAGAKPAANPGPDWVWVSAPDPVHTGKRAMKRSGAGVHQHYFTNASQK